MSETALVASPDLKTSSSPLRSASLSSNAYVLSLVSLPGCYASSASSPSNVIDIFDKTTLQRSQTLAGHVNATTSLHAINAIAGHPTPCLVSSGKDGSIKVWDGRSNSHSIKMTNLGQPRSILCCDVSADGLTVAGGTDLQGEDAQIIYWDPRQPAAPLRTHSSTHSDDVTALSFSSNTILSASSDGLVCVSNPYEDDEDEAVQHVCNWGCSVSQAGWIDPSSPHPRIWAASDMETFSTWSNELDPMKSLDIRGPSIHNQGQTWVTDYLICCQSVGNNFGVFVGSNEGDVALLSNSDLESGGSSWTMHSLWTNGHTEIVRSLLWDEQDNVLVTGGEDSKLNVWSLGEGAIGGVEREYNGMSMDVDVSPRKRRDLDWEEDGKEGKRARR